MKATKIKDRGKNSTYKFSNKYLDEYRLMSVIKESVTSVLMEIINEYNDTPDVNRTPQTYVNNNANPDKFGQFIRDDNFYMKLISRVKNNDSLSEYRPNSPDRKYLQQKLLQIIKNNLVNEYTVFRFVKTEYNKFITIKQRRKRFARQTGIDVYPGHWPLEFYDDSKGIVYVLTRRK